MNTKTGKVIISKDIKIDKDYKNVMSYTNDEMIALLRTNNHLVYEKDNCSFLRDKRQLILDISYSQAVISNYIAFQNPDYSNKWFFGFIDSVEYHSEKSTIINYTVDEWTTWFDDWDPKQAFIIREHVTDDSIGANTVPENLELGEFIINETEPIEYLKLTHLDNMCIIVGISKDVVAKVGENIDVVITDSRRIFGGIYSGLNYLAFRTPNNATNFLKAIDEYGLADDIYGVFILPLSLLKIETWLSAKLENITFEFATIPISNNAINLKGGETPNYISIPINSDIDGYVPKNNKLYTAPFNYLLVSNNVGSEAIYRYEDFTSNNAKFKLVGTVCIGGSIKLLPYDYKKTSGASDATSASIYGLNCGKYPTCSYRSDSFTNWLTQNSVNLGLQMTGSIFSLVASTLSGNVLGASLSGLNIANQVASVYQAEFIPNQAKGNVNAGDIAYSGGMIGFRYFKMSIRNEYAKIIDDYFTAHGYKVNRLKKPNIKTRKIFNYLQISNESDIGYGSVPNASMLIINNIARAGVTIWHNHNNIGSYTGDNSNIN